MLRLQIYATNITVIKLNKSSQSLCSEMLILRISVISGDNCYEYRFHFFFYTFNKNIFHCLAWKFVLRFTRICSMITISITLVMQWPWFISSETFFICTHHQRIALLFRRKANNQKWLMSGHRFLMSKTNVCLDYWYWYSWWCFDYSVSHVMLAKCSKKGLFFICIVIWSVYFTVTERQGSSKMYEMNIDYNGTGTNKRNRFRTYIHQVH